MSPLNSSFRSCSAVSPLGSKAGRSVARCHTSTNRPSSTREISSGCPCPGDFRTVSGASIPPPLQVANGKTLGVRGGIVRIKHFAQDRMGGIRALVTRIPQVARDFVTLSGHIDLLCHLLIVHITVNVFPALHLSEDPYGHGVPGEGVKIDAVRGLFAVAQAIGIHAGE